MAYGWRVKNPDAFIRALVKGLQAFGDDVFTESQRNVPVDKGTLKDSGEIVPLDNGFLIHYRTEYAARQEFGVEPGTVEQVPRHPVKRHHVKSFVRNKPKQVKVVAHYRGPFDRGPFERRYPSGVPGRFYLTNAFEKFKPRLIEFITRLAGRHS